MINNGRRAHLVIAGVFDGMAGVQGSVVAFAPNRAGGNPGRVKGGVLDGVPVMLDSRKDEDGPFWTAHFRVF